MAQLAQDTFQRANETPLSDGGSWTKAGGTNVTANLVSNQAVATNTLNASRMVWTGLVWPNDQRSEVTIGVGFNSNSSVGANVRGSSVASTMYELIVTPTTFILRSIVAGAATNIQTGAGTFAVGDIIAVQVVGTILTGFKNGVQIASGTSSAVSSGNAGFTVFDAATPANTTTSLWTGFSVLNSSTLNWVSKYRKFINKH